MDNGICEDGPGQWCHSIVVNGDANNDENKKLLGDHSMLIDLVV